MKKHIKLILRIIAASIDLFLGEQVDSGKSQPSPRCSIEGLWMVRP